MRRSHALTAVGASFLLLTTVGCTAQSAASVAEPAQSVPQPTVTTDGGGHAEFAVITDFGNCDEGEREVAQMVAAWNPQIVATAGDNTQGTTDCIPFVQSVGNYYATFLAGPDGPTFFPVPGNHDYENDGAGEAAYLDYFAYLGSFGDDPLWYTVTVGNVNLFMLDSELSADQLAEQRDWLRSALSAAQSASDSDWNVVVFHRPPFTSGPHEPNLEMQPASGWDYSGWGADLVVSGHQHVYEDLEIEGFPYLVAGVGAGDLVRPCPGELIEGSNGCTEGYGALLVQATDQKLTLDYRAPDGGLGTSLRSLELSRNG